MKDLQKYILENTLVTTTYGYNIDNKISISLHDLPDTQVSDVTVNIVQ